MNFHHQPFYQFFYNECNLYKKEFFRFYFLNIVTFVICVTFIRIKFCLKMKNGNVNKYFVLEIKEIYVSLLGNNSIVTILCHFYDIIYKYKEEIRRFDKLIFFCLG